MHLPYKDVVFRKSLRNTSVTSSSTAHPMVIDTVRGPVANNSVLRSRNDIKREEGILIYTGGINETAFSDPGKIKAYGTTPVRR